MSVDKVFENFEFDIFFIFICFIVLVVIIFYRRWILGNEVLVIGVLSF